MHKAAIFKYPMERDSHCSLLYFVVKMWACSLVLWTINQVQTSICVTADEEIQRVLDGAVSDNNPAHI